MPRYGDRDAARLQGREWTPAVDGNDLRLWLDAGVPQSITLSSGNVSEWRDLSPFGNHATQGTASNRPGWSGPGAGVSCATATDDLLVGPPLWSGSNGEHAVVMTITTTSLSGTTTFSLSGTHSNNGRLLGNFPWFTNVDFTAGNLSTSDELLVAWSFSQFTKITWTALSSQGESKQYLRHNGTVIASDTSGSAIANVGNYDICDHDGSYFTFLYAGRCDEHFVRRLEGYAAWRNGTERDLPADHPYRNRPPIMGV